MKLHEWMVRYVRHKDIFARKLKDVKEEQNKAIFTYSDHTLAAHALEELTPITGEGKLMIITLQTKENVTALLKQWSTFVKQDVVIVFVNLQTNEKWSIRPSLHERVTDGNIETGIWSMAEAVSFTG